MKQMGNFVINDLVMTRFACYRRFWEVWRDSLIRAEQTKTFHHQWFGDFNVLPRFHGDPSWKNTCIGVWTLVLAGKEFDDMRHRLWVSRTLQWRLWRFRWVWVMFYHRFVCWKDKWCEFGHFSDETLVLHAWKQVLNQWVFLKQIENKQPVQTSFRCVFVEIAVFS